MKANRIDFSARLAERAEPRARKKGNALRIALFLVLIALAVGAFFYYRILFELTPALNQVQAQLEDTSFMSSYSEAENKQAQLTALHDTLDNYEACVDAVDTFPILDKTAIATVRSAAGTGIGITNFSYTANGLLTLSCETADRTMAAQYVKTLRESEEFAGVFYKGYTQNLKYEGETTRVIFSFSVTCLLKGGDAQ